MRSRTKARARALQVLYAWEMSSTSEPLREVDHDLGKPCSVALDSRGSEYAYQLLDVIEENLGVIDQRVESLSENWRLSRMPVISSS